MLDDSFRIHAFTNQLVLHHQTVRDHAMRQPKRKPLSPLLHRRAKTFRFTFRSYARRHAGEKRSRHAENIREETVRVNALDLFCFYRANKATRLIKKIPIKKSGQRIFRNPADPDLT